MVRSPTPTFGGNASRIASAGGSDASSCRCFHVAVNVIRGGRESWACAQNHLQASGTEVNGGVVAVVPAEKSATRDYQAVQIHRGDGVEQGEERKRCGGPYGNHLPPSLVPIDAGGGGGRRTKIMLPLPQHWKHRQVDAGRRVGGRGRKGGGRREEVVAVVIVASRLFGFEAVFEPTHWTGDEKNPSVGSDPIRRSSSASGSAHAPEV
ncbi:hypothetical protein BKA70DRAFT_1414437 [Coprinopsis sp. MPI-PUGE-AT-0042]|nr:hypothetical protein BKA70DRAFT_1414437 [Coprinopsis sp. MPI-PUGE-AT-0042]